MPIITKPSPLEKDATGVFSLDKTALALHPTVVASEHFSSPNVWDKIIVKYKSDTLGQFESVEFDATVASPEGQFFVSATAEDVFEVEKITIIDKDGAILLIPRASLTVAEFDIDFSVSIPSSFLSVNSQEINANDTTFWGLFNGNRYSQYDGATRVIQRTGNGPVRALGVTLIDGNPTVDGMEWTPTSVTISGGNTSSSFTQIKTFTFVRSDFTADTLKYLVLDSDQSFEFYRITFNTYDKTYGGSLLIQGDVGLHLAYTVALSWNNSSTGYLVESDNGATTTAQRSSGSLYDIVYGNNESFVTGDFVYEAVISTSLQTDSLVGFYDTSLSPVYNTFVSGGTNLNFLITSPWNTLATSVAKPVGSTFMFKITRTGTTVKLFVNNVEVATKSNTTIAHLKVPFFTLRPNDYIVSATITVP